MEVISHLNIKISGFPFQKIISLKIQHNPNEHGTAEIVGEIESSQAENLVQRVDEKTGVLITTSAEGQPEKLFCGCVKNISMQQENEYSFISLQLYTKSKLLDVTKRQKTYQNTAKTYGAIITDSISDIADLHMMVSDKAIGKMIMKYNETDWEFSKRMAYQLGAPLITDIYSTRPQIYMGMPPASKTITVESNSYSYGTDVASYMKTTGAMAQDFAGNSVISDQYAYIGDQVVMNGKTESIKSVNAYLEDGILHIQYGLMSGTSGAAGGSMAGIAAPVANSQASGKMMSGIVKAVKKDMVQVHVTDIDPEYDSEGSWWFPFSTAYSSSDGSGWYCMPEVEDQVRVFFPSGSEGDAFAASSTFSNPPTNPRNKCWKAPGGKEILLTDEGMYIIGKSGKIFINLTDEDGILIHSDKDIKVSSDANVSIQAENEVHVVAKKEILIGTEEAYLSLTKNTATLAASKVLIN